MPPQSWATVTTGPVRPGPVMPSASVSRPRSSTRCASTRGRADALGVAHAELIRRDHPPARRRGGQQPAPQVAPGRVAVHAQQGADRLAARRLGRVQESSTWKVRGTPSASAIVDQPGPRRVEARAGRPAAAWPAGAVTPVPRTGSPDDLGDRGVQARADAHQQHPVALADSSSEMPARVNGIAAGPRLPRSGRSAGPGRGRCPGPCEIALVCTVLTWCMT